jgi:hypothetical protein
MKKNLLLFLLVSFCLCMAATQGYAQKSDPYRKPQTWEKLKKDPNNRRLWSKYLNKKYSSFTKKDKAEIESMKQALYIEAVAEEEAIVGVQERNVSEEIFAGFPAPKVVVDKPNLITIAEVKQLGHAEAIILEQPSEIEELKTNITTNFIILEDKFKELFESMGQPYKYFHEVHPEGDYSELRWIEEQELKIKLLKKQEAENLRKGFTIMK